MGLKSKLINCTRFIAIGSFENNKIPRHEEYTKNKNLIIYIYKMVFVFMLFHCTHMDAIL